MSRILFCVALLLSMALSRSSAHAISYMGIGVGFATVESGPGGARSTQGADLSVKWLLSGTRSRSLGMSLHYTLFGEGYYPPMRGTRVTLSSEWQPRVTRRLSLAGQVGFLGMRTLRNRYYEFPTYGRDPEYIGGFGPSVGATIGVILYRDDEGSLILTSAYDRAWASDGYLDVFMIAVSIREDGVESP